MIINQYIIALDQGSSSSRALAFDFQGRCVEKYAVPLVASYPAAGMAEYDGRELLQSQLKPLDKLLDKIGAPQITSIAVSSQRSTVVLWDKRTGDPLCPVLTWQDGRAFQEAEEAPLSQQQVHRLTGLYKTPFYSAAKITWCVKNYPQVKAAADAGNLCVGPVSTYLVWHLTKGQVFAVDPALAQRMLLLNIQTLQWDDTLLNAFKVKRAWLPEIKPSTGDFGHYNYEGNLIPINVCCGDQQASLFVTGFKEGSTSINYGTGAFFQHNTGPNLRLLDGILTSLCASNGGTPEYMFEGPVNAAGSVFGWLKELGGDFDMDQLDLLYSKAKQPVWFLPALGGLGAPYWDFKVSPVFAGLSPQTKKADILAGAMRGIGFLLADIVFYLEKSGIRIGDIKVSGGIASSHALMQFQSDILQHPVLLCDESESTALGTAMLAAREMGVDVSSWEASVKTTFKPQFSKEEAAALYQQWQKFVQWCRSRA